ncbi:MAG: CopD family protein [Actinomycetota bacterium]|nr:CopD family protein [Actinomycetota bacterium]
MGLTRRGALCALVAIVITWWLLPATAGAHTAFESSDPADGAVASEPVETIRLVFTGEAAPAGDGFDVLDPSGTVRTPTGTTSSDDGTTWTLTFDPPLAGGDVGVRWSVQAPDTHPISGSFRFSVTAPAPTATTAAPAETVPERSDVPVGGGPTTIPDAAADDVTGTPAAEETDALAAFLDAGNEPRATSWLSTAGRFASIAGTVVGAGALAFAAWVLRGARADVRAVLFWTRRGGLAVMAGAALELGTHVASDVGLASPATMWSSAGSTFGVAVALRALGGLVLCVAVPMRVVERSGTGGERRAAHELAVAARVVHSPEGTARPGPPGGDPPDAARGAAWQAQPWTPIVALGVAALLASFAFDGHTVSEGNRLVASAAAVVHVAAGAAWAGGLAMLALVLQRRHRRDDRLALAELGTRFSTVATAAIVAVGLAGVALAVSVLDDPDQLWGTPWGRWLLVKVALVALAAGAGAYNHRVLVPAVSSGSADGTLARRFRLLVTAEAGVLAGVVVATVFLVAASTS